MAEISPYKVLGVRPSTSYEEAKRIFRKKMKTLHPDLGGDPKLMMEVKEAWDYLSSNRDTMLGLASSVGVTHKSLFEILDKES